MDETRISHADYIITQFEWNSAHTLVPLIVGFVGLLTTVLYEKLWAKEPFLRHSLYHNASSVVAYLCGCIQGMVVRIPPYLYRASI